MQSLTAAQTSTAYTSVAEEKTTSGRVSATSVESQIPAASNTAQGKSLEQYKISKKEIASMVAWTTVAGTAGAGCGALVGSVAGAIVGLLGGPVGVAIGAAVGGLIGSLAGAAITTGVCVRAYRNTPQQVTLRKLEKASRELSKAQEELWQKNKELNPHTPQHIPQAEQEQLSALKNRTKQLEKDVTQHEETLNNKKTMAA